MLRTRTLPRLPPATIRRSRLERWLATHASMPLRLVIAPPGSGKTTLLLKYLPNSPIDAAYCALAPDSPPAALYESIAAAFNLSPAPSSYSELLAALQSTIRVPTELVVDDADNASPQALQELRRLIEEAPELLTFVCISRSRNAIEARNWIARGLAVLCDARRLAFDSAETQLLAEACGVAHTHNDVTRLIEESDGWAVVLSGGIRCAAEDGRSMNGCFQHWRERYGQPFAEFIAAELEAAANEEDRALLRAIIAGADISDEDRFADLEAKGLFVISDGTECRPYRPLRQIRGSRTRKEESPSPMLVRMFGHFEARIGGREIRWIRRRDQQIVKYLLLKTGGTATRSELASTFWPDADVQLAAQSVRTACSNIRKALAAVVGYARVDAYFHADPDVSLNLQSVAADVRRFSAHVSDGDAAFDRGDLQESAARYRAAEELYAGRLLDADVPEAWFSTHAQLLEDRYVIVLERLAQIAFDDGDMKSAADYAQRVRRLRPDASGLVEKLGRMSPQYRLKQDEPVSLDERRRRNPA